MRQQNLDNQDVFWLWWVLAPQLESHEEIHHSGTEKVHYKIVSMARKAHGGFEAEELISEMPKAEIDDLGEKTNTNTDTGVIQKAAVEIRHYHIQRGHWYNSISMILLVILIIILIPIAAVIAFSVVISLFVNQSLFTILANF